MDPAKRDKLMDQWEAAKAVLADAKREVDCASCHCKRDAELQLSLAYADVDAIEDKFPECRHWASRFAGKDQ